MEHIPAFRVKSIDSTGAGDAFIGSFAVFLGEGLPEILRYIAGDRAAIGREHVAGAKTRPPGNRVTFSASIRIEAAARKNSRSSPLACAGSA